MKYTAGFRVSYGAAEARRLFLLVLSIDVLLVVAYLVTRVAIPPWLHVGLKDLFDLDREISIPTWYSSLQLSLVSAVVWLDGLRAKRFRAFLTLIALGFVFLSIDETAEIHENISHAVEQLHVASLAGREYLVWMSAYLAIAAAALVIGFRSSLTIWRDYRRESLWILGGGVVFVLGAVGLEIVGHILVRMGVNTRFILSVAAEEFCEMAGVSVMLYGFMRLGLELDARELQ